MNWVGRALIGAASAAIGGAADRILGVQAGGIEPWLIQESPARDGGVGSGQRRRSAAEGGREGR